jgi:hypothetical protein
MPTFLGKLAAQGFIFGSASSDNGLKSNSHGASVREASEKKHSRPINVCKRWFCAKLVVGKTLVLSPSPVTPTVLL